MVVETKIETQPRGGGERIAALPADIILYGERLNAPGPIQFALSADHETATRENVGVNEHEAVITRNGQVQWCGPVLTLSEQARGKSPVVLDFGGEGLAHYFKKMNVTSVLQTENHPEPATGATEIGQDQFEIARSLVAHHQAKAGGDFGIDTSAASLSGVTRDRLYRPFKNVYEALTQLADVDGGIEFSVHPDTREFELWHPKKGARKNELIWDERTIESFVRREDGTTQASQVLGEGAGEREDLLTFALQDSGAVAKHKLTQAVYVNKGVLEAVTLEGHVRRELALFKNNPEMIGITVQTDEPEVFSYQTGDEGWVRWPSKYDAVNKIMRLVGRDIVWTRGRELAVLYLEAIVA